MSEAKTATGATTPPLRIGFVCVFFAPPTGARKETASASGIVFVLCVTRASEAKGWGRRCGVDARAGVRRRVVEDWAIARLGDARGGWRLRAERCGRARLRLITTSDGYDDEER